VHEQDQSHGMLLRGFGFVVFHAVVTLLAIGIAFSLPAVAEFILYQWWPQMESDSSLLLKTEIGLASILVLLFNLAKVGWDNSRYGSSARLALLVHACSNDTWVSRYRARALFKSLPVTRDACVLTVTGFDTFARKGSPFGKALENALDIRVMLLNPRSQGARQHLSALWSDKYGCKAFWTEIEAGIAYLDALHRAGKKVALKFYDQPPFWKLALLGEHAWVQFCHRGCEVKHAPEYVFALHRHDPKRGLFVPFHLYFLEKWEETQHAQYDFHTRELVYRDPAGREFKRLPVSRPGSSEPVLQRVQHVI
jgi:hypothetical protein